MEKTKEEKEMKKQVRKGSFDLETNEEGNI